MDDPAKEWQRLTLLTRRAARELPMLPTFPEVCIGDRETLFRELGYTFWNQELVEAFSRRLLAEGSMLWVELTAGTGRWAAELARRGVDVAATDDYSQSEERVRSYQRPICYGLWVAPLSAREALERLSPEGVLCAWPPLGSCLIPDLLPGR
jgi:hypothetical protein